MNRPHERSAAASASLAALHRALGNAAAVDFLRRRTASSTHREAEALGASVRRSAAGPAAPVHDDSTARALADGIGARAFSFGGEIFLGSEASMTPGRRAALIAHESTHVAEPHVVQRATAEEADMSILRAALLDALERARSFARNARQRRRLRDVEARVPAMDADELRSGIAEFERIAVTNEQRSIGGVTPMVPTATAPVHTDDDLIDDPDRVIRESRNHRLHLLITLLKTSNVFGAVGIRNMLGEMGTNLDQVQWIPASEAGFSAMTDTVARSGGARTVRVFLGPAMLMLMNRPDEDMIPTLFHEISHSYATFRRTARPGLPAVPNLSRQEMHARVQQLAGTPMIGDAQFAGSAVEFARRIESELYAELIEHSAIQDPDQRRRGPRTVGLGLSGGGVGTVTLNVTSDSEREIEDLLGQLQLLFGDADAARIARALADRSDRDRFVHPASRRMFRELVDFVFPRP